MIYFPRAPSKRGAGQILQGTMPMGGAVVVLPLAFFALVKAARVWVRGDVLHALKVSAVYLLRAPSKRGAGNILQDMMLVKSVAAELALRLAAMSRGRPW